jgi:hypothetical protein
VVAVDGLFMVVRRSLMSGGKLFDDDTFTGFHFYDMDLCAGVSSREQGAIGVTHGILVAHEQKSDMTEWDTYRRLFVQKYRSSLPLKTKDCVPGTPPSNWDVSELPDKAGMLPSWFWELRADWARSAAETTKPPS